LRIVHQDLGLVLELGVVDNLAMVHSFAQGRFGTINWQRQAQQARALLRRFDVEAELYAPLSRATPVTRAIVAIVAALQGWEGAAVSSYSTSRRRFCLRMRPAACFEIITEIGRSGTSVLFVSHRLEEVFRTLRPCNSFGGGERVTAELTSNLTVRDVASLMAGEEVDPNYRPVVPVPAHARVALDAKKFERRMAQSSRPDRTRV
jgi:ABC-type sugar transport system ATPase subunit